MKLRFRIRALVALLCATLATANVAAGDVIVLRNRRRLQGEVISRNADSITLDVGYGKITLKLDDVLSIEHQATPNAALDVAGRLLKSGDYERAAEVFRRVLRKHPDNKCAREGLAQAAAALDAEKPTEVRSEGDDASGDARRTIDPAEAFALARRARNLVGLGRWRQGLATYARIAALAPQLFPPEAGFAGVAAFTRTSGGGELRLDDLSQEARAHIEPLASAFAGMGRIAFGSDDYARAVALLVCAAQLDAALKDDISTYAAAAALAMVGDLDPKGPDFQTKKELFESLAAVFPDEPGILFQLAEFRIAEGRNVDAAGLYARGLGRGRGFAARLDEYRRSAKELLASRSVGPPSGVNPAYVAVHHAAYREVATPHLVLRYRNDHVGKKLLELAEFTFREVTSAYFPDGPPRGIPKITLTITATRDDFERLGGAQHWSPGQTRITTTDGEITSATIATYQTAPWLFERILPHEMTHAVVGFAIGDLVGVPTWLQEGLAVAAESHYSHFVLRSALERGVSSGRLIPFDEIVDERDYPDALVNLFYAESYVLVSVLVERKGLSAVLDFAALLKTLPLDAALLAEYGVGRSEIERSWLERLNDLATGHEVGEQADEY